jgi:chromatin structure-remodeling complex subunit RSC1/2
MPAPTPQQQHVSAAYTPAHPAQYHSHSQSPAPHAHQQAAQVPAYQPITPHVPFTPQPAASMQSYQTPRPAPGYQQPYVQQPPTGYKAPQPVEVFVLNDHANLSIPQEIREQFQRDEKGRVLFFTAPPLNVEQPLSKEGRAIGHSARYLAAKAKKEAMKAAKRKAEEADATEHAAAAKKAKMDEEQKFKETVSELGAKALKALEDQLAAATKFELEASFNGKTKEGLSQMLDQLTLAQEMATHKKLERELHALQREEDRRMAVTGMTVRLEEKI